MTNFEFYKDKLMAIAGNGSDVAICEGEPTPCDSVVCSQCELGEFNCCASLIHWLYAEHVEKPKINKRTKMFFDAIETGWVARDSHGALFVYPDNKKPTKDRVVWLISDLGEAIALTKYVLPFLTLDFITWEDEEPWRVEDIRNLEVV